MASDKFLSFRPREFKGSRLRCLLLSHRPRRCVAEFLTALSGGNAQVSVEDKWAPDGFLSPNEAKLGVTPGFLPKTQRTEITKWWLKNPGRANTPNWDLVSTANVGGRPGLLVVEAKSHEGEFSSDRCGATNQANFQQIKKALEQANDAWNQHVPGFALSAESYYQLSNRFAFAWKLAELNVPVVLVYLGCLNAEEMSGRRILSSHDAWRNCVVSRAGKTIPEAVWDRRFEFNGTPVTVMIRSADVRVEATVCETNRKTPSDS